MRQAVTGLAERLGKRLALLALATGLVVGSVPPASYYAAHLEGLIRDAERRAGELADLLSSGGAGEILARHLADGRIVEVRGLDGAGRLVAHLKSPPSDIRWWEQGPMAAAAITSRATAVRRLEVRVSQGSLLAVTSALVLISVAVGAVLWWLIYTPAKKLATAVEPAAREAVRERELLVEIGRALGAEREAERFLRLVTERASALFGGEAILYLLGAGGTLAPHPATESPVFREIGFPLGRDVVGTAADRRRGVIANNYSTWPDAAPELRAAGVAGIMAQPLALPDRLLGVLAVHRFQGHPAFHAEDLAALESVTAQVAFALENTRLSEEARAAVADLDTAYERLLRSETLRAVGELAGGAAHHLNNLLMVVIGRTQLLLTGANQDPRRSLEIINRAGQDAAEVVRRVQQFSREKHEGERQLVDVNTLVGDALEVTRFRWQDTANAQGVAIDFTFESAELPAVYGDVASLREVIMNLILNAVEALPTGGQIRLKTRADPNGVVVTVADNGVGMSEETRRRAADPFFTTKGIKRTGLGLSASFGVVRRHGGSLDFESAPGKGTVVTVRLPAERLPATATGEPAPVTSRPRKRTVVLIDDDARVREVLAAMLESQGHEVIQAGGGEEGVAILATRLPDLVLTDLGMPGMTGWEVAQAVKTRHPRLPVGLITGWADELDHNAHGLVDFVLAKPLTAEALAEAISRVACLPLSGEGTCPPPATARVDAGVIGEPGYEPSRT